VIGATVGEHCCLDSRQRYLEKGVAVVHGSLGEIPTGGIREPVVCEVRTVPGYTLSVLK
jgi:hypothetical protein